MKTMYFNPKAVANNLNHVKTSTFLKSMMTVILLCSVSLNIQAQNDEYYKTKDDLAVSVGVGANSQIINAFSTIFSVLGEALITSSITGGTFVGTTTYENEKDIPALSVEYFHHFSPVVSIGAIAAFNGTTSDMYCKFQRTNGNVEMTRLYVEGEMTE